MSEREPLVGAREVADYLGVPAATLANWRHRNAGPPSYRVGRHVKYRMSEVERWLERQRDREPATQ